MYLSHSAKNKFACQAITTTILTTVWCQRIFILWTQKFQKNSEIPKGLWDDQSWEKKNKQKTVFSSLQMIKTRSSKVPALVDYVR